MLFQTTAYRAVTRWSYSTGSISPPRNRVLEADEFSFFLCYHLSEVIRIRGADTFTPAQRHVLAKIAGHLAGRVTGDDDWSTHLRGHCVSLKERTDVAG